MKAMLLTAMLLLAGATLLPEASAQCEPNPVVNPDFCDGVTPDPNDLLPERCYTTPQGIRCDW